MQLAAPKKIARLIEKASHRRNSYDVFGDCMAAMAIAISNAVDLSQREERERQYMEIVGRYDSQEVAIFPQVLAELTMDLEGWPQDVLGQTFHELELHNKARGQFFTPYDLCRMMAEMQIDDGIIDTIESQGFITAHEPACGSGAMVIALAEAMQGRDLNYQQHLHVTAVDIDQRAVHMAYVQLSLLHIPAVVYVEDTLTMVMSEVWYTPAHVLGGWGYRLRARQAVSEVGEPEEDEVEPQPMPDVQLKEVLQPSLFGIEASSPDPLESRQ